MPSSLNTALSVPRFLGTGSRRERRKEGKKKGEENEQ
jgi:hypothetical protein